MPVPANWINISTPKWMVYNGNDHKNEWFWGYPYFRKPHETCIYWIAQLPTLNQGAAATQVTWPFKAAFAWTLRMISGMSRSRKTSLSVTTQLQNIQKTPNCLRICLKSAAFKQISVRLASRVAHANIHSPMHWARPPPTFETRIATLPFWAAWAINWTSEKCFHGMWAH